MKFYRSIHKIHALSFDLDDTLYDNLPMMIRGEKRLIEHLNTQYPLTEKITIEDWRQIKKTLLMSRPKLASDMGELRRLTLKEGLSQVGYAGAQLASAVNDAFDFFYYMRSDFKVDKNIHSLLNKLASKVPLVAITNGNVNLEQIDIAKYFSHCLKANIEQPMKPHPIMFERACIRLNLKPESILHVGDNMEKDVMGAINAGMNAAWFACNRSMQINHERISVLPHVHLEKLEELEDLIL
ncbi:MAG: 5-amino-6-(5-phospho-D-ribitylamino)uracil phosphatase YigB [Aliiglaciecola sp.]